MPSFSQLRRAALVTKHRKAEAIAPVLRTIGFDVHELGGIDTDAFGTFTGEIPREGDARRALERKLDAAPPEHEVVVASEGSFGPHPVLGLVPCGLELVAVRDRRGGFTIVGRDFTLETNHRSVLVHDVAAAFGFAGEIGFPSHGVVVVRPSGEVLAKGVRNRAELEAVAGRALRAGGPVQLAADMRAHMNPTRMRSIARAAEDLARRYACACPRCAAPGFAEVEAITGRPCAWCGEPTSEPRGARFACVRCAHAEQRLHEDGRYADPARCDVCNP